MDFNISKEENQQKKHIFHNNFFLIFHCINEMLFVVEYNKMFAVFFFWTLYNVVLFEKQK